MTLTPEQIWYYTKMWEDACQHLREVRDPIESEQIAAEIYWASKELHKAGYQLSEDNQWFHVSDAN